MSEQEINKIIAEFCDWKQDGKLFRYKGVVTPNTDFPEYTKSLDALVPVWKKLKFDHLTIDTKMTNWIYLNHNIRGEGETIQLAAAHATAKAIKELTTN